MTIPPKSPDPSTPSKICTFIVTIPGSKDSTPINARLITDLLQNQTAADLTFVQVSFQVAESGLPVSVFLAYCGCTRLCS